MLFGEYDYETDIRVQRQESFEAGEKQKADEDAIALLKLNKLSLEDISTAIGIPLEHVKELAAQLEKIVFKD